MNPLWMPLKPLGWANVSHFNVFNFCAQLKIPTVYKNFVKTIRAVEYSLGIPGSFPEFDSAPANPATCSNATQSIATTATFSSILTSEICDVLQEAIPIILQIALDLEINLAFEQDGLWSFLSSRNPLVTVCVLILQNLSLRIVLIVDGFYSMMDIGWQYNNPSNPADAAKGPQGYDNHLYYS